MFIDYIDMTVIDVTEFYSTSWSTTVQCFLAGYHKTKWPLKLICSVSYYSDITD